MMKQFIKKIICNTILTGLLLTILPFSTSIDASEVKKSKIITGEFSEIDLYRKTSPKKQIKTVKISKEKIDRKLKAIKKTIKGFKILKFVLNSIAISSIGVALLGIGAAVLSTIISTIPAAMSFGVTSYGNIYAVGLIGGITIAAVAAIVAGFTIAPQFLDIFGGLSSRLVIESALSVNQLNNIEKKYPGTLDQKQKTILAQFKNIMHSTILKGTIMGIKIKLAIRSHILEILEENPKLVTQFFGKPKAMKIINKYIIMKIKKENLENAVSKQNEKIKKTKRKIRKTKNIIKKTTLKALLSQQKYNLTFLFMKKSLKKLKNKIVTFNKKYKKIEEKVANHVQGLIDDIAQITKEFKSPK